MLRGMGALVFTDLLRHTARIIASAVCFAAIACSNEPIGSNLSGAATMLTPANSTGASGAAATSTDGTIADTTVATLSCAVGESPCAGVCLNTTSDPNNCGGCNIICGADQLCDQGACRSIVEGCSAEFLLCGQSCVNASTDPANCGSCGNTCDPSGQCEAGVCTCNGGLSACGNTCIDLLNDVSNCGTCSNACLNVQSCNQGLCECPLGQSVCGETCVDTLSDIANCGTCGTQCAASQTCQQGVCACPDSQVLCGDICVDTTADPSNCGMCGTTCPSTQVCTAGSCVCPDTHTLCGDLCVDTQTDAANCGVCGTACGEGQVCTAGVCACPEGQSLCDNICIDTLADNSNCGACGIECAFGEGCAMGVCSGGAAGDDGCAGPAQNIDVSEIALYQTVKVPVMSEGAEVGVNERVSDVVSGRPTLVRAFVAPGAGWTARTLSARLFLQNSDADIETVYSDSTLMIQGASSEEERDSAFEFTLTAEQITADTVYAVELVECDTGQGDLPGARFPADGGQELGARDTGGLRVHIVPIRVNNRLPDTEENDLLPYRDGFLATYPISALELTVGDPIDWNNDQDWNGMLDAVATTRQNEGPDDDVYYYGMLRPTESIGEYCRNGCVAGVGFVPQGRFGAEGRAAVGLAYGDDASVVTILHEVGHNHGRNHSPCVPRGASISGVDGAYPYDGGLIGVYGYDFRRDQLMTPSQNTDIMGYCDNQWLSDYTYNGLLDTVVSLNLTQFSVAAPESRIGAWQVLLIDPTFGVRWGNPVPGPAVARGVEETADILDAFGNVVEQVAVYRSEVSDIDAFSIQIPEPQPGWHQVRVDGAAPIAFAAHHP